MVITIYHKIPAAGAPVTAAGALPFTGFNVLWWVVAIAALIAAGLALLALVPRRRHSDD
jgi:hypothetical protein